MDCFCTIQNVLSGIFFLCTYVGNKFSYKIGCSWIDCSHAKKTWILPAHIVYLFELPLPRLILILTPMLQLIQNALFWQKPCFLINFGSAMNFRSIRVRGSLICCFYHLCDNYRTTLPNSIFWDSLFTLFGEAPSSIIILTLVLYHLLSPLPAPFYASSFILSLPVKQQVLLAKKGKKCCPQIFLLNGKFIQGVRNYILRIIRVRSSFFVTLVCISLHYLPVFWEISFSSFCVLWFFCLFWVFNLISLFSRINNILYNHSLYKCHLTICDFAT